MPQAIINHVEDMAAKDGVKSVKFKNRANAIYDNDWIAGVDYEHREDDEDNEDGEEEYIPNTNQEEEPDSEEEEDLAEDDIDEDELGDLEEAEEAEADEPNPAFEDEEDEEQPQQEEHQDIPGVNMISDVESTTSEVRRSDRDRQPVERLEPNMSGPSYLQASRVVKIDKSTKKTKKRTNKHKIRKVKFWDEGIRVEQVHNIVTQTAKKDEYTEEEAVVMAIFINEMNNQTTERKKSFLETYSLKQGIKKFGEKGYNAAFGEMLQLHQRKCFKPVGISEMTNREKKRALESLIFLVEKRDGRVKGRTCANGSVQRDWVDKKDASSPTAYMESIMLTATIDAEEERDVATIDIPNFFIQTPVERKPGEDKIILKIRGVLVDMLMQMDPELYGPLIVYENGKKVLYTEVLQAIYGMLQSALLAYKKLRKDLETDGFVFNPYDPCVANKKIDGENLTVLFHVDDLKVSHKDRRVVDQFEQWVDFMYGDPKIGKIKAVRGKVHEYLAMTLDYTKRGEVKIEMKQYVQNMLDTFPIKFKDGDAVNTPAADNLFKVDGSKPLEKNQAELFHTTVAKALFLCKRARPDVQPTVAFLCTRVRQPNC